MRHTRWLGRSAGVRLRGSMRVPLAVAVLPLVIPAQLSAHTVGISRGEYERRGRELSATLVFARPELAAAVAELDRDGDGSISWRELVAGWRVLDEVIVRAIDVRTRVGPCAGTLRDAALTEQDGLTITALYRCPDETDSIVTRLNFLSVMSQGHRHLVTARAGGTISHIVAYAGNPEFGVTTAAGGPDEARHAGAIGVLWPLFRLGVVHILTGYDHLVFLLGLILVGGRVRPLLFVVTAFTVAHSITLGLAVLRIWAPSALFVEPAIALSIAYVGVENWFVENADRRWLITFPFGLVHGFGFAGALQRISLPDGQVPFALAAFNGGVEAGQIAVLIVVLPTLLRLRRQQWFADRGVKALSTGIAVAGAWWFITRVA